MLTPCRLDGLCIGAWFAIVARGSTPLDPARLAKWAAGALAAVLAVSVWHVLDPRLDVITLQLRTTFLAILFGACIYAAAYHPRMIRSRAMLRAPWLRMLGKYSYGLYVFHGLISYFLARHPLMPLLQGVVHNHTLAAAIQVAIGVALSVLISVVSYEFFERRFLELKERFGNSAKIPARVPASVSALTDSPAAL